MTELSRLQTSCASLKRFPTMKFRLRSAQFRFVYTFASGHKIAGIVEGDYCSDTPHHVFNLRALMASCLSPQGFPLMIFDTVYGQLSTTNDEIVFCGSYAADGSLFSFNYRGLEASIYDAATNTWMASGWNPRNWHVETVQGFSLRNKTTIPATLHTPWAECAIA
ncbi:MAG: hypothetical protein AAGH78_12300 [Cyanobacteria bacterium P01_H01_bin.58]